MSYAAIVATFTLAGNLLFTRLLGLCPAVAASSSLRRTAALSSAVIFVGTLSSAAAWVLDRLLLEPLRLQWLETLGVMLLAMAATRLMDALVRAISPCLSALLGRHSLETMTNSAVLGVCFVAARADYGLLESFVAGLAGGIGYFVAALVIALIHERLELEWVPRPLRGAPIALISAGILALAFMGFEGLLRAAPQG